MKNFRTSATVIFSFLLLCTATAQISLHNGQVRPLRYKGTGPTTVQGLCKKLETHGTFLGGITSHQWLEMVADGINYQAASRLGYDDVTSSQAFWFVQNATVVATRDLGVSQNAYYSSGSKSDRSLVWIINPNVPDSLLVYEDESGDFIILAKWDCLNPTCDLQKAPAPKVKPPAFKEREPSQLEPARNRIKEPTVVIRQFYSRYLLDRHQCRPPTWKPLHTKDTGARMEVPVSELDYWLHWQSVTKEGDTVLDKIFWQM